VLPVADAHQDYAETVVGQLKAGGFRSELIVADEGLGKRIAVQKSARIPYVLVVGDTDVAAGTVGVNARGQQVERDVPVSTFLERLAADVAAAAIPV